MNHRPRYSSPKWVDPYSPEGIKEAAAHILTGVHYRVFYEGMTRRQLIDFCGGLGDIAIRRADDEAAWREKVKKTPVTGDSESENLRCWLIGLGKKTAQNLELPVDEYPKLFDEIMRDIEESAASSEDRREMALLLWCGAATLTIRGSAKAKTGKALEKSLARAALTVIGLDEDNGEFRLNIGADVEVERETDAEIQTGRGWVRMEVGLIGKGNSGVISEKVGRMDKNGVVMLDILPNNSTAWQTAENRGVCLIQIRNNNPVEELRKHLEGLDVPVQSAPMEPDEIKRRVMEMPLEIFGGKENLEA